MAAGKKLFRVIDSVRIRSSKDVEWMARTCNIEFNFM